MRGRRAYDHASALAIGMMKIVCADCQEDLGERFCKPELDGHVTLGRCISCDDELSKKLGLSAEPAERPCRRCGKRGHAVCRLEAG